MPIIDAAGTQFGYDEYGAGEDVLLFMHGYLGSAAIRDTSTRCWTRRPSWT